MARSKKSITTKKDAPGSAQPDINFEKELWDTAVRLRGNIAPADYKHYILPLLFLRYLSLKYDRRREELEHLVKEPSSEYCTRDPKIAQEILNDPDEYKREGVFIIPEEARWDYLVRHAQDDDIKLKLDHAMDLLEQKYPELKGILPKIYAGSNLSRENVTGLINIFSRDIFKADYGKESDVLGRVYEYFITNFASTEGIRGGEFFTLRPVVKLLVAMMEPKEGKVFDPACGSGGMFVQSAAFTKAAYTRRRGLDRETNKALLIKHLEYYAAEGSQLRDLMKVLPNLSRGQIQSLMKELKQEERAYPKGKTKGGRWFLGSIPK
jgi:type I restriction enzyme M protein